MKLKPGPLALMSLQSSETHAVPVIGVESARAVCNPPVRTTINNSAEDSNQCRRVGKVIIHPSRIATGRDTPGRRLASEMTGLLLLQEIQRTSRARHSCQAEQFSRAKSIERRWGRRGFRERPRRVAAWSIAAWFSAKPRSVRSEALTGACRAGFLADTHRDRQQATKTW